MILFLFFFLSYPFLPLTLSLSLSALNHRHVLSFRSSREDEVGRLIRSIFTESGGGTAAFNLARRRRLARRRGARPPPSPFLIRSCFRACTRRRSTTTLRWRSAGVRSTSATSRGTTTSICSGSSSSPTAPCSGRASPAAPPATASSPTRRATARGNKQRFRNLCEMVSNLG